LKTIMKGKENEHTYYSKRKGDKKEKKPNKKG